MSDNDRTVVLWDIDGTLLTTARAGVVALEDGVAEILDRREDLSGLVTSGLTDRMIARAILASLEIGPDPVVENALLAAYCRQLPYRLTQRRGRVMEGVIEILERLRIRRDVSMLLLTGNMRAGATAKLRSYALEHYFDLEFGGFGDDGYDRIEIAAALLDQLAERQGIQRESVYIIGDTPFDVVCGKEVGVRTVAVASGLHGLDELLEHDPWWVVERLPPAHEFLFKLGLE